MDQAASGLLWHSQHPGAGRLRWLLGPLGTRLLRGWLRPRLLWRDLLPLQDALGDLGERRASKPRHQFPQLFSGHRRETLDVRLRDRARSGDAGLEAGSRLGDWPTIITAGAD
jgi:hypothetical protein